jgi:hypothetical protein
MKILILITFTFIFNCVPDLTSDKGPDRNIAQEQCLLSTLLYLDESGRFYQDEGMGFLALESCDRYLNWDPNE